MSTTRRQCALQIMERKLFRLMTAAVLALGFGVYRAGADYLQMRWLSSSSRWCSAGRLSRRVSRWCNSSPPIALALGALVVFNETRRCAIIVIPVARKPF